MREPEGRLALWCRTAGVAAIATSLACGGAAMTGDGEAGGPDGGPGEGGDGGDSCSGETCEVVCQSGTRPLGEGADYSIAPAVAADDQGYAVAWTDDRADREGIHLALIGRDGVLRGEPARIVDRGSAVRLGDLTLSWTGDGYGLAWAAYTSGASEIYFARLDATGQKLGSDRRVTEAAGYSTSPSLVWNGAGFGLSFSDARTGSTLAYFVRLDDSGEKLGDENPLAVASGRAAQPDVVWNGASYDLVLAGYNDNLEAIYFTRVDATGQQLSDAHFVVPSNFNWIGEPSTVVSSPSFTWNGDGYGIAWAGRPAGTSGRVVYLTILDRNGVKLGDHHLIGPTHLNSKPQITWTGDSYSILLGEELAAAQDRVLLAQFMVSADGESSTRGVVSTVSLVRDQPSQVWSEAGAAQVFGEGEDKDAERVIVLRSTCP
jgi:hypothetical protein